MKPQGMRPNRQHSHQQRQQRQHYQHPHQQYQQVPVHTVENVTNHVLKELEALGCYVVNESITTTSRYLKFRDATLGSLRIGDHPGVQKYPYRWNIDIGGETCVTGVGGRKQYHYNPKDLRSFYAHIRKYHAKIQQSVVDLERCNTETLILELQKRGFQVTGPHTKADHPVFPT